MKMNEIKILKWGEGRGVRCTDKGQQINRFFTIYKLSDKKTD